MSHFARVLDGLVVDVLVADQDFIDTYGATVSGDWVQTSYNTMGGIHYDPETGEPSQDQSKALRKNYAGIGFSYDPVRDAFIPPQPFSSWLLNEDTCLWQPPTPRPDDKNLYNWDEQTLTWIMTHQWNEISQTWEEPAAGD